MAISQSRRNQIESQLAKFGISASDEAINGVVDILKSDQRATVASACRRYAQSVNPQIKAEEPQQPTDTNSDDSDDCDTQTQLEELTEDMSDRIAEGIVSEAVNRAIDKVLGGNWKLNAKTKTKVQDARKAINVEFSTVKESFLSLPSVGLSTEKLLPSSEEIFDNAVVGTVTQS